MTQTTLSQKKKIKYTLGRDNKIKGDMQRIRISQGCYRQCDNCYEPLEVELYMDVIDKIERNKVVLIDMNILDPRKPVKEILNKLIDKRVNNKKVYYEMGCGFDFTQITPEIAHLIYKGNFGVFNRKNKWSRNIKLAWDRSINEQDILKKSLNNLIRAGFKSKEISMFIIINYRIPLSECDLKLDFLKRYNIKVCPCCYDGGFKVMVPKYWSEKEIKYFSNKCSIHNQLINFGIFPDKNKIKRLQDQFKRLYRGQKWIK